MSTRSDQKGDRYPSLRSSCSRSMQPPLSHLEPRLGDLPAFDLVGAEHIHFTRTFWIGSLDRLVIHDHVADDDPCQQLPEQVRFPKAFDVPLTDGCGTVGQQGGGEGIVLAVVRPPLNKGGVNVVCVVCLQLHLNGIGDLICLNAVHRNLGMSAPHTTRSLRHWASPNEASA